jgi:putative phosphonate metabolism protein
MNRYARYAIYYMPDPDSPLWSLASHWLGRDAASGRTMRQPALPALVAYNIERLTAGPRHYGFHATLKAPFEPAHGSSEGALLAAVEAFSAIRSAFDVQLEVGALGDFLALRLAQPSEQMVELHTACVRVLDEHRQPISAHDLARKRHGKLTPEQDAYLVRWGYPYIFEHFRFHMTLTSRIANEAARGPIRDALAALFAPELAKPHRVTGVAVFGQVDRDAPFDVVQWFPLRGQQTATPSVPESAARA